MSSVTSDFPKIWHVKAACRNLPHWDLFPPPENRLNVLAGGCCHLLDRVPVGYGILLCVSCSGSWSRLAQRLAPAVELTPKDVTEAKDCRGLIDLLCTNTELAFAKEDFNEADLFSRQNAGAMAVPISSLSLLCSPFSSLVVGEIRLRMWNNPPYLSDPSLLLITSF